MSKKVVESVNPSYTGARNLVTSIGEKHTDVADLSDINAVKRELNNIINGIKQNLDEKISSINKRINQIDSLPGDIRKVIETTNNQQALLLRNVYREIADNLSKQQQSINDSLTKTDEHIQQLRREHLEAEQIYSNIQSINKSLSSSTQKIESLNNKVILLFVLIVICLIGLAVSVI